MNRNIRKCPYCDSDVSFLQALTQVTNGEYTCPICNKNSNISFDKKIYIPTAVLLVIAVAITVLMFVFKVSTNLILAFVIIIIPFAAFFFMTPLYFKLCSINSEAQTPVVKYRQKSKRRSQITPSAVKYEEKKRLEKEQKGMKKKGNSNSFKSKFSKFVKTYIIVDDELDEDFAPDENDDDTKFAQKTARSKPVFDESYDDEPDVEFDDEKFDENTYDDDDEDIDFESEDEQCGIDTVDPLVDDEEDLSYINVYTNSELYNKPKVREPEYHPLTRTKNVDFIYLPEDEDVISVDLTQEQTEEVENSEIFDEFDEEEKENEEILSFFESEPSEDEEKRFGTADDEEIDDDEYEKLSEKSESKGEKDWFEYEPEKCDNIEISFKKKESPTVKAAEYEDSDDDDEDFINIDLDKFVAESMVEDKHESGFDNDIFSGKTESLNEISKKEDNEDVFADENYGEESEPVSEFTGIADSDSPNFSDSQDENIALDDENEDENDFIDDDISDIDYSMSYDDEEDEDEEYIDEPIVGAVEYIPQKETTQSKITKVYKPDELEFYDDVDGSYSESSEDEEDSETDFDSYNSMGIDLSEFKTSNYDESIDIDIYSGGDDDNSDEEITAFDDDAFEKPSKPAEPKHEPSRFEKKFPKAAENAKIAMQKAKEEKKKENTQKKENTTKKSVKKPSTDSQTGFFSKIKSRIVEMTEEQREESFNQAEQERKLAEKEARRRAKEKEKAAAEKSKSASGGRSKSNGAKSGSAQKPVKKNSVDGKKAEVRTENGENYTKQKPKKDKNSDPKVADIPVDGKTRVFSIHSLDKSDDYETQEKLVLDSIGYDNSVPEVKEITEEEKLRIIAEKSKEEKRQEQLERRKAEQEKQRKHNENLSQKDKLRQERSEKAEELRQSQAEKARQSQERIKKSTQERSMEKISLKEVGSVRSKVSQNKEKKIQEMDKFFKD